MIWLSLFTSQALGASVAPLPGDWRRRAGRPRHTWLRTVESDLAPLNIGLATAYHRAQNRQAWSKLVGTATSASGQATWWWWWPEWQITHKKEKNRVINKLALTKTQYYFSYLFILYLLYYIIRSFFTTFPQVWVILPATQQCRHLASNTFYLLDERSTFVNNLPITVQSVALGRKYWWSEGHYGASRVKSSGQSREPEAVHDSDLMRVLFCAGTERVEIEFSRRCSATRQRQLLNQRQQRRRIKPITDYSSASWLVCVASGRIHAPTPVRRNFWWSANCEMKWKVQWFKVRSKTDLEPA